jgi:Protein of unknown function (DUF1553)/Protein of unknown function (DUF1549)/Planctomycete cytochrome C/Concanavalin A-like lectin/glucanases superfamily
MAIDRTPGRRRLLPRTCLEGRAALRSLLCLVVLRACLVVLSGGLATLSAVADEPSLAEAAFFEADVRPLLVEKCGSCHGDAKSPKGGLQLTSREGVILGGDGGAVVTPGKPDESPLIKAVRYLDEPRMPPKERLKDREIEILSRWVAMGLPWPGSKPSAPPRERESGEGRFTDDQRQFWSFRPIKSFPAPEVRDASWARSPVDRFILSGLERRGFRPSAPADKRTLIRRATFDLIGLPPSPEEAETFLADGSPEAFERVVDRLLASPRYGERWGRHWLDLVRYADARDLIQLPPESDFREVWRYRDWVVSAFNRDLPYPEFLRHQIVGDLLPPSEPGGINADGLVATGMLAIADFVPGDVDKDQMIADYVNDEVDVIGRAFLGLSLACARCHDHKFDPISTEDYYALAGIFFSTRLIPGPVPGNTPLVRVPLLPQVEIAKIQAQDAADGRRRAELDRHIPDAADREYIAFLKGTLLKETARYLVDACELRRRPPEPRPELGELAKRHGLDEKILASWVDYLGRVESQPLVPRHPGLRDAASGRLIGPALEQSAGEWQAAIVERAAREETIASAANSSLSRSSLIHLRADDPQIVTTPEGRVSLWPGRSGLPSDARAVDPASGPSRVEVRINGHAKKVLRFDGQSLMEVPRRVPPIGSLFVVFRASEAGGASQRLLGWEDSDVGQHGLGLMVNPAGPLQSILRDHGKSGDLVDANRAESFEVVCVTWGSNGTALYRNGGTVGGKGIESVSSDAAIKALHVGGPGSGGSPRFRGEIAEIRVYDRPLDESERRQVEAELSETWFNASDPNGPARDLLADWHEELLSARGPFWLPTEHRATTLPEANRARLADLNRELDELKKKPPREIPRAVVVQDGGPPGTRHEGFKDAQVFLRGNPKKPGKMVPRGFPRILTGEHREPIAEGSGRRQLADWLARPDHPLTARVMVNRIWQHHFGEGLVRTPNDFGKRGERPTHPELLDDLAGRFVDSGWSIKAMHRLIMLTSTYQQSAKAATGLALADPDNRLLGRMSRRRLDAEAIRDSLLVVAGRLDTTPGGPAFLDPDVPRRTLYLSSARTGASTSGFGRLFDRADPGSIVDRRGESIVAPQALFFMNDPFVGDQARALAARVSREGAKDDRTCIHRLYNLLLSRVPTEAEIDIGLRLLAPDGEADPWERYCLILLGSNEFIYLD